MIRATLYAERKKNNLTQKEIAGKIGISKQQYSKIEKGEQNGSLGVWQKLAKVLNKSIDYLLEQESNGKE